MLVLQRRVAVTATESDDIPTVKLVASASVRHYPWLIRSRKHGVVSSGKVRQVGAPFRLWGQHGKKPCPAAVFRCGACGGHDVCIIANVKAGAETCWTCAHTIHGAAVPGNEKSYKSWRQLLARYKQNDLVEYEWLHGATGVIAFIRDVGPCPGDDYYLCRRVGAMGWIRGNTYWRRAMPGVWSTMADDSWHLWQGNLRQIGQTMRLPTKPAVFRCDLCDRNVIESRNRVLRDNLDRCLDCREAGRSIEWRGERMSLHEWGQRTGIPASVLHDRQRYGWDAERMLMTPPKPYRGRHVSRSSDTIQADLTGQDRPEIVAGPPPRGL